MHIHTYIDIYVYATMYVHLDGMCGSAYLLVYIYLSVHVNKYLHADISE